MHPFLLAPLLALLLTDTLAGQELSIPDAATAIEIQGGDEGDTLLAVAEAYAGSLSLPLAMSEEVRAVLGRARVGLLGDVTAPAESVHMVAQSLLVLGGFVVTGIDGELKLDAYTDGARTAIAVDEAALDGLAGQEALLVKVPAQLEGVDARQLAVTLRALAQAGLPGPMLHAPDSRVLEVEGPAESVRWILEVLHRCSAGEEENAEPIAASDWRESFPTAADVDATFTVSPDEKLLPVLTRYSAATGRVLWVEENLRKQLQFQDTGVLAPITCAVGRAHALVEALLVQNDVSITVRGSGPLAVHALQRGYWVAPTRPVLVDLEGDELDALRDHPATTFGGVIRTKNLDTRMLTTSLRVLFTDANHQAALAMDGHAFYVHGGGASAAHLTEVVGSLDGADVVANEASLARLIPAGEVEIGHDEGMRPSLLDLLKAWSGATKQGVILSDVDVRFLGNQRLDDVGEMLPAGQLHDRLQGELVDRGLALAAIGAEPALLTVSGPATRRQGPHRFVAAGQLDTLKDQRSLLVTTLVPLEKLDARATATRMRGWILNPRQEHLLAAGGGGVVLGGPVGLVRARVEQLREFDATGELPEPASRRR